MQVLHKKYKIEQFSLLCALLKISAIIPNKKPDGVRRAFVFRLPPSSLPRALFVSYADASPERRASKMYKALANNLKRNQQAWPQMLVLFFFCLFLSFFIFSIVIDNIVW